MKHRMFWIPKSCASYVLRCQSRTRELFYYQWSGFHKIIWRTAENRAHTLLLVILRGNYVVNNNLLNFIFLLRCWITLKPKKELKNFSIFCSQNDRTKLKIGKIYDRSSDKYVPMTERYFDPWLLLEFMFSDFLLNALCHQNILKTFFRN